MNLTRLGFGLNVAPVIMSAILSKVLKSDRVLATATSSYLDDIYLDQSIAPTQYLIDHLAKYGLQVKPPEQVAIGARVLGLRVWREADHLKWKSDNAIPGMPSKITRRAFFSMCGHVLGHLPVCGQLRVMTSYLKRRVNMESTGWDDPIPNPEIREMAKEILEKCETNDPATGRWDVTGNRGAVWVDASSLSTAVVLDVGGQVVEDGCWLRPPHDTSHINMAELDALLKGLNMAIAWGLQEIEIFSDSKTVYHWVTETLTGKAKVKSSGAIEMLILRRLGILKSLVEEFELQVKISFVRSECNRADVLTRVPAK